MNGIRIKSIEIEGFKSFPQKVHLKIPTGITAIVGPNGSGKSNIFDAIKWCFGDHSPRSLRIKNSEDVLFAGNDKRKPAHTCEVSITFEGEGIKTKYRTEEIKITRRYYRTGENEYLFNGEDVRLKDIQNFLLDMGAGAKSIAIIDQGEIVNIAIGKPEELRFYVDEATGIMKYKLRHKEAVKKLELTRIQLERAEDVIKEVRRQMRAIERHVKKAEKAKKVKEELEKVETALYAYKYHNHIAQLKSLRAEGEEKENKLKELRKFVQERESTLSDVDKKITVLESEIREKEHKFQTLSEKRESITKEIHRLEIEAKGLMEKRISTERETKELLVTSTKTNEQFKKLSEKHKELVIKFRDMHADVKNLDDKLKELKEKIETTRNSIKQKRELIFELSAEESRIRSEMAEKDKEIEFSKKSLQKLEREKESLMREYREKEAMILKLERNLKEKTLNIEEKSAMVNEINEELNTLSQKKTELLKKREELFREKENVSATLHALEQSILEGKFYSDGTKTILEHNPLLKDRTLNRCIEVKSGFEKAVEGVLKERKESILTHTIEEIVNAFRFLNEERKGRASFTFLPHLHNHEFRVEKDSHIVARGDEVITARNELGEAIKSFFKRVLIIKSIEDYLPISERIPEGVIVATLNGDVIEGAFFYGGTPEEGIISKETQVASLKEKLKEISFKISSLELSINTINQTLSQREEEVAKIKSLIEKEEIERRKIETTIENLKSEVIRLKESAGIVEEEIRQIYQFISQNKTTAEEISKRSQEIKRRIEILEVDIKNLTEEEEKLSREIERISQEWQEKRIETSGIENALRSVEEELAVITKTQEEIESKKIKIIGSTILHSYQYALLTDRISQLKKQLREVEDELKILSAESNQKMKTLYSLKEKKEAIYRSLSPLREEIEKLVEERGMLSSKITEIETTLQFLKEEIYNKYRKNLETIEFSPINYQEYEEKLKKLREEYAQLGDIAFYTLDEYEELSQRYEFLNTQRDDLIQAMEDVNALINRINHEAKEIFEVTFEKIKRRFSELISVLMKGAEGNLYLSNPDNMFESGIEITIQPQGKKLKHLHLLSGGEKAIVAIAFVFSLLEAKDMPFIFLDEIDAPLDDVNVKRFNALIRKIAGERQIVLITHNKITMEEANALYGVSMEEPGVSKILSVALR